MDRQQIIETLRSSAGRIAVPAPDCPKPEQLAAWTDGQCLPKEQAALQAHTADCAYCLQQVAAVLRSMEDERSHNPITAWPGSATVTRREAGGRVQAGARLPVSTRWPMRWAAAAVMVLAIGLFTWNQVPSGSPAVGDRVTRYVDNQTLRPDLLSPAADSVIQGAGEPFRWTAVPGSLYYDIRLLNSDGELLLRERIKDTQWLLPKHLALTSGEEYFVRIDAYLDETRYLSSEHRVFQVAD